MKICRTCGNCCFHTEMILSEQDINRIHSSLIDSGQEKQFWEVQSGYKTLLNVAEHCIFYDSDRKLCQIYEVRPEGCRFYPMVFDENTQKCILDEDCPHRKIFYSNPHRFQKTCKSLRHWLKMYIF